MNALISYYRANGTLISFSSRAKLCRTRNSICSKNRSLSEWVIKQIGHEFIKHLPFVYIRFYFVLFLKTFNVLIVKCFITILLSSKIHIVSQFIIFYIEVYNCFIFNLAFLYQHKI